MASILDPTILADAQEAMLRLRVGSSKKVLMGVCSASAVLVALAWTPGNRGGLLLWYLLMLVTQGVRIWSEEYACQASSGRPLDQRMNLSGAAALASGLVQATSVLFFPMEDPFEQSLHTLILLVMSTGAVVYSAGYSRTYYPYMVPIVGGLAIAWWTLSTVAIERPWLATGFGLLILVYGFNLLSYARGTWTMFLNAAAMRRHEMLQNQRLAVAVRTAEAASHAKTQFLAAASHDLRQPIHTIALLTGVLKLRHRNDASSEAVAMLNSVVQSLSHQLDDLLDISKLDAGVVKTSVQPLSLPRFLSRRMDEVRTDAQEKGLRTQLEAGVNATVCTDPNLLERVLRNLLSNAVKFTTQGEVSLSLAVHDGWAVVQVRDTGCGIPKANQAEVFREFVQLGNPERDRTKGMGLGLSIVERLCKLMEIDLRLQSEPGQGTCVELRLALLNTSERTPETHPGDIEHRRLGLTVLVVDNEAQVRSATAMLLTELGCRCLQAEDLSSAQRVTQRQRPDFLLADYRLRGGEDGVTVVRALRERHPGLPAAIVTGDIGSAQLQAIELAGLRLMHKPMRVDTLMQLLADGTQGTAKTTSVHLPTPETHT